MGQELPRTSQHDVTSVGPGSTSKLEGAALLESLVDGAAYRFFFSDRGPWNGTADRSDDGAISILWRGETSAQDRRFALAAKGDRVVVVGKPDWGELIDAKRRSGVPINPGARQPRSSPERAVSV